MDTFTILTQARALIADPANWRKGSRRSGQPNQYCSEEAIEAVTGETGPDRDSAIQVLSQIVGDKYPFGTMSQTAPMTKCSKPLISPSRAPV